MTRRTRRSVLAGCGLGVLATPGCVGFLDGEEPAPDDGDPDDDDARSDDESLDDSQTRDPEFEDLGEDAVEWRFDDGDAAAALHDGRLFGQPDPATDACLIALDAADGERLWDVRADTGWGGCPDPTVGDAGVFAGYGNDVGRGGVLGLAHDGTERWDVSVSGGVYETPHLQGGTVYAVGSAGEVVALDAADGAEVWTRDLSEPETITSFDLRASASDRLVVADRNGQLVALDRIDGTVEWEVALGESVADVLVADDVYYATDDDVVGCVRDGAVEWSVSQTWEPAIHGRIDDAIVASEVDAALGLDAETGETLWQADTSGSPSVLVDDRVHVADGSTLRVLSGDGTTVRSVELDVHEVTALATDGDATYAPTSSGVVRVGADESVRGTSALEDGERIVVGEERVYVGTGEETYALAL